MDIKREKKHNVSKTSNLEDVLEIHFSMEEDFRAETTTWQQTQILHHTYALEGNKIPKVVIKRVPEYMTK